MKTQQEIEKEFDTQWNEKWETGTTLDGDSLEVDREAIKSFIRQVRQDDIKSLIEWAESKKRLKQVWETDSLPWVRQVLARMEVDRLIYNQALDEIIFYLKSRLLEDQIKRMKEVTTRNET